jgi:hypothetical protein
MSMEGIIDLVTLQRDGLAVVLVMAEHGDWSSDMARLERIQTRFNHYLSFALDGEFRRRFPEHASKRIRIRIDCASAPDPVSARFLDRLAEVGRQNGIETTIEVCPEPLA